MLELGQLEKAHEEFARRKVRVFVVSPDDMPTSKLTQADFPHLIVVSDEYLAAAKALDVVQAGANPNGGDTNAPTTFFVDGAGTVRWLFRPDRFLARLSPEEVLTAIDKNLP